MDNNSNSKMNELLKVKYEYKKKIIEIEEEIEKLLQDEVNNCEHEWIKEREPGQYGELYNICSKCRVDINLSFIHR